jgi:hypothetical protein
VIQGSKETIFLAEISGLEDQTGDKLGGGVLHIKVGHNLVKDIC